MIGFAEGEGSVRHVSQFTTPARPRWMRTLNGVGRLAPRLLRPDADAWWRAARKSEAREPTRAAAQGLAALVASLEGDAALNLLGRFAARDDSVRLARTSLRIGRALADDPRVRETKLPPMVFIVGWPRTGTTALHTLLAADPTNRTIPYWESFDPVPPAQGAHDRRAEKVDRMLAQLARFAPDYQAIHPMRADQSEECVALFMNHFRTLQFDIQYRVPDYVDWLLAEDARVAYQDYRDQLKLIHHHRPLGERFVLKDPTHLVHLDTLLDVFPDAKVVFTHRNPADAISSICSLYAHTRAIFSDDVDPKAIGREILAGYWPKALRSALALRDRLPRARIADVRHADLERDPIATLQKLYADLELPSPPELQSALTTFLELRDAATRSVHEHSPRGFGLRRGEIDEQFDAYRRRFDLAADAPQSSSCATAGWLMWS